MRVLVTGGAGFIGTNLVRRLLQDSTFVEIRVLDDLSAGSRENLTGLEQHEQAGRLTIVIGSILDSDVLGNICTGVDAVVHLAARGSVPRSIEDPVGSNRVNVDGTLAVLEAARQARSGHPAHVVFASSSSVYGANADLPKRESMLPMPMSPYAVSKLAGEQYTLAYARTYGMQVLPFRFFNVFGPYQSAEHVYAAVIPRFIAAALDGLPVTVYGDGLQSRDFTYVETVCDVLTKSILHNVSNDRPVNLAFGSRFTLLDVISMLEDLFGRPIGTEFAARRASDVMHSQADNAALLGLFPDLQPVDLRSGLSRTIAWFRDRHDEQLRTDQASR